MTTSPTAATGLSVTVHPLPINEFPDESAIPCAGAHEKVMVPGAGWRNTNEYGPLPEPLTLAGTCPLTSKSAASIPITGLLKVTSTCDNRASVASAGGLRTVITGGAVSTSV